MIAWLGGLAFAGSLAYLVFFYAVVLGRPDADAHHNPVSSILINTALFSAFALHHSLFARHGVKRRVRGLLPRLERTLYVWIASALLVLVCGLWQQVPGMVYDVQGAVRTAFYAVQVVGAILIVRAARVVDALDLAGIRQATDRERVSTLKIVGPFRVVRHPIYLGWMLVVFGAPTLTMNRLVFAVITSLYLIVAIPWEERSLIAAHGDAYRAYRRTVRFRIVPGVW